MDFLFQYDVNASLTQLRTEVSRLKSSIFGSKLLGKPTPDSQVRIFKNSLNDILKKWENYTDAINGEIINLDVPEGSRFKTLRYAYVKNFIFCKYDYASIVSFCDGALVGIRDGVMKKPDAIEDFFAKTVNLAFKLNADSVGELVELYLHPTTSGNEEEIDSFGRKMMMSIRDYRDMFPPDDRGQIYSSIAHVVDSLVKLELPVTTLGDAKNGTLIISVINQTMEYIIYTVASYILRVFTIGLYVAPAIKVAEHRKHKEPENGADTVVPVTESTDPKDDLVGGFPALREFDHAIIRDPRNLEDFMTVYRNFLIWMGVEDNGELPPASHNNVYSRHLDKIELVEKVHLKDNLLFQLLERFPDLYGNDLTNDSINIEELHYTLKASLVSITSLDERTIPRDDFMHIIRGCTYGNSPAEIKHLSRDLFFLTSYLAYRVQNLLNGIKGAYDDRNRCDTQPSLTISSQKLLTESYHILLQFYEDFIFAIFRKVLHLERAFIIANGNVTDDVIKMTSIDLDDLLTHSMMSATPATLRMPIALQDQFEVPVFEYLEMRNEFLRSLPEFKDDLYLSEAGSSSLINALVAFIQGIFNSIAAAMKNFKPASDWVIKHEAELKALKFAEDVKIEGVLPYRITAIDEYLKGMAADQVKQNIGKSVEEFAVPLYGSKEVYDWFAANKDTAAVRFKNKVLFGVDSDKPIAATTVTGAKIVEELKGWVDSVKASDAIMKKLTENNKSLQETVKLLQTEATKPTATTTTPATPVTKDAAPDIKEDKPATSATTPSTQGNKPAENKSEASKTDQYLTKLQNAMNNIWVPIYQGIFQGLKDEYGYVKKAYSLGKTPDTTGGSQPTANPKSGV